MIKRLLIAALTILSIGALAPRPVAAASFTGQHVFAQQEVEPAYNGETGRETFLLIPGKATISPRAPWSPIYLPMYPESSSIGMFDCLPTNCDHVNVLPADLVSSYGLQSVYPLGTISTKYGTFTGGLVKGHDHILTGSDSEPIRHVFLVLFTAQGVADGAINREITTVAAMRDAIARGDASRIDTGGVIHASEVAKSAYVR